MKYLLYVTVVLAVYNVARAAESRMICYYDTTAATREGDAKFTSDDMAVALKFCTHIIYGYAGITPNTFEVTPLSLQQEKELSQILKFKQNYPQIKFLLSIGGDRDVKTPKKYIDLLEAGYQRQQTFVMTSLDMLKKYNFDGLDLAYQFPRTKPKKFHSSTGQFWKKIKKQFSGDFVVDSKKKEHKKQFSDLVNLLRTSLKTNNYMLTLTVLPNVDSEWYFDAPVIMTHLDFVTLAAFDFYTPARNPEEADYTAPIHGPPAKGNRIATSNIDTQVNLWLAQKIPRNKINVGVPTWGRAWKLTSESTSTGDPIVLHTKGPASEGSQTKVPGLLSWPEICVKFRQHPSRGGGAPLRRVVDPTRKYGNYALSGVDKYGNNGIWISYEEPKTASYKAWMVRNRNLGGAALFDIGLDDLRGVCTGEPFNILRAMKYELL